MVLLMVYFARLAADIAMVMLPQPLQYYYYSRYSVVKPEAKLELKFELSQ